ncbi:hypothetical protein ACLOJK_005534 [Asimina triloba]
MLSPPPPMLLEPEVSVVDRDGWWEGGDDAVNSGRSAVVAVSVFTAGRWQADEAAASAGDGGNGVVRRRWSTVAIGLASGDAAAGTDDRRGDGGEGNSVGENRRPDRP